MPMTRISQRIATGTGADRHVAIRSLAEQSVCEANAARFSRGHRRLGGRRPPRALRRDAAQRAGLQHHLPRPRAVRVSTTFEDSTAYARLVGDGFESEVPRSSTDPTPYLISRPAPRGVRHHAAPRRLTPAPVWDAQSGRSHPNAPAHAPQKEGRECSTNRAPRSSNPSARPSTTSSRGRGPPRLALRGGSFDIQAKENLHYRPLWDLSKEIYDESFSVLRLTDPYSFTDPRQYYYAPYVTSRAGTSDAFGATLAYLESRDLLERLPAGWKDLLAQLVIPLRPMSRGPPSRRRPPASASARRSRSARPTPPSTGSATRS